MGLFDLFKKDPEKLLERAGKLLERGDPAQALRLARQAGADPRAGEIVRRAREALVEAGLERAKKAEESDYLDDAVEWIRNAAENVDGARREELLARAEALLKRAEAEAERRAAQALAASEPVADAAEDGGISKVDVAYDALVGMLDDDLADRYDEQPEAFRRAFVDLNEGRAEAARPVLEELADEGPGDTVRRFERGRCRLHDGEYQGAREDFEAVWQSFGDEPIDRVGTLSVPGLWAEAMLGLSKTAELLERLDGVADPSHGDPNLCRRYAAALVQEEKLDDAERFLVQATGTFSQDSDFPFQLAVVLKRQGRTDEAIDCLEGSVAPSCAPATCGRVPKHLPSLRALARLYLNERRAPDRVHVLLDHIAQALAGQLGREDYVLMAEYHEQVGDVEGAREARAAAQHAGESTAEPAAGASPSLTSGRRVL